MLVIDSESRVVARTIEAQSDLEGHWLVTSGLTEADRVVVRPAITREGALVSPVLPQATASR